MRPAEREQAAPGEGRPDQSTDAFNVTAEDSGAAEAGTGIDLLAEFSRLDDQVAELLDGPDVATAARPPYVYPRPRINRKPGSANAHIEAAILDEIDDLGGKPTTVRFLYYRLVAEGVIPKTSGGARKPSQTVSEIATDLRLSGVIPLGAIVDRGRGSLDFTGYPTIAEGVEAEIDLVRLDPWGGNAPQVWTESDSLAGVIEPIADRYRVPLVALHGQASISLAHEMAQRVTDDTTVLYLGDLDRSGRDIEASIVERVEAFAGVTLDVERLAVTEAQVADYGLPVLSRFDARTRTYSDAVETEALGQARIERIVEDVLDALLGEYGWTLGDLQDEDERQRDEIRETLGGAR